MLRVCMCDSFEQEKGNNALLLITLLLLSLSVLISKLLLLVLVLLSCFTLFLPAFSFLSDCLSTFPPVLLSCIAVAMCEFL